MFISKNKYENDLAKMSEVIAELVDSVKKLEDIVYSDEFTNWREQYLANKEVANKSGEFYLSSKTDTQLLERLIQEVNKDPDLAVILRTADGTTLTLRSYPVQLNKKISSMTRFSGDSE